MIIVHSPPHKISFHEIPFLLRMTNPLLVLCIYNLYYISHNSVSYIS
jgi:hypothetical protein